MSRREKILAASVGLMLLVVVVFFATQGVRSAYSSRNSQIAQLEKDIRNKQRSVHQGVQATNQIALYEEQSLPGDADLARSLYQRWLLESVAQVQLSNVNVNAVPTRGRGEVYQQLSFSVNARGNLEQLTQWMHNFYSVGYLHRIRQLLVKPIKGTKLLDLKVTVEAISISGVASQKQLSEIPPAMLAESQISEYTDAILGRNLFGPPNQPPRLSSANSQRAVHDSPLSFTASATDADQLDKLTYRLVDNQLEGAQIDPSSGQFRWTPKENGSYQVTVEVSDDGYPSKSSRQLVSITVADPPPTVVVDNTPRPPAFDIAKFTWLTSILEVDGKPAIWLFVRTTGQKLVFNEGDKFEIGSMSGVISRIGSKEIEIDTGDRRIVVLIGDNLSKAREIPAKDI